MTAYRKIAERQAEAARAARLVRITVRVGDMDEAVSSIYGDHAERCLTRDKCDCVAIAERLERTVAIATGERKS